MPANELAYILVWPLALWLLGWAVLPLSRRLFATFPDSGLAAGRSFLLVLSTLVAFWGAACHILPLQFAPVIFLGAALAAALAWRQPSLREWAGENRRSLLLSDAVYLVFYVFFLWIRLRHPETDDLEKPMDMAFITAATHAKFLPFQNPWYTGADLTNYYYFGPLMGSVLARSFATPTWYAYNLIQPAFCAAFLSVLWSLCSAVTRSRRWGLLATLLVGLGGNLEPLRQIATAQRLWPMDWWTTSRVIKNTINEYPAFTLIIGDAHAHFYAFSLSVLFFSLCFNLLRATTARARHVTAVLCGVILGSVLLTNTWDAPLYVLLLWFCIAWMPGSRGTKLLYAAVPTLAPLVAAPYFLKFHSQVSGVVWNPWMPNAMSFFLLWGGWWLLTIPAFGAPHIGEEDPESRPAGRFCTSLFIIGLLALVAPYLFYIRGYFGDGDLRHIDTVFKFGLQGWILLGISISCALAMNLGSWLRRAPRAYTGIALALAAPAAVILALAPITVTWARTVNMAPKDEHGNLKPLSLNAMRFVPETEQAGMKWLSANAQPGDTILEPPGDEFQPPTGRFATFSGVPTYIGWPQHVWFWGADYGDIQRRQATTRLFFSATDPATPRNILKEIHPTYVVFYTPAQLVNGNLDPNLRTVITQSGTLAWAAGSPDNPEFPLIVRTKP